MQPDIILCVDDDTTVLNALRTLLGKSFGNGVVLEIAESAQEALEICTELAAEKREVAVLISDFIMPGMRGDELLVRAHQISPRTVTILLSGQSELAGIKRCINEANLFRFLEKPFDNVDLVQATRAALAVFGQQAGKGHAATATAATEKIAVEMTATEIAATADAQAGQAACTAGKAGGKRMP